MKKILFLDFDGVLHSTSTGEHLLFSKLDLLTEAISKNPCRIVISSSWRFHNDLDHLKSFLPTIQEFIVGTTGDAFIGKWPRYNEIKQYLNRYDPWADWRALDDSFLEFPKYCQELILCQGKEGLTEKQILELSTWLLS